MNTQPFFSIVIPVLDEEIALPLLFNDLLNQTFLDFEVITVDGKSTDRTQEIVKEKEKHDQRFSLVISEKRSVGAQRNLGGKHAKGKYIFFMDSDNRLPDYFLEGMHYHLLRTPYKACTTYSSPDTNQVKDKVFIASLNQLISLSSKMNKPMVVLGACLCCTKKLFEKTGGFDETLTYAEDLDFVKRLAKETDFHVFSHPAFIVSLRRFRKEGTLNMYRKLVPLLLKLLIDGKVTEDNTYYPMKGGTYYFSLNENEKKRLKTNKQSIKKLLNLFKSTKKLARFSEEKIRKAFDTVMRELE